MEQIELKITEAVNQELAAGNAELPSILPPPPGLCRKKSPSLKPMKKTA